jgi:hypothetical protein
LKEDGHFKGLPPVKPLPVNLDDRLIRTVVLVEEDGQRVNVNRIGHSKSPSTVKKGVQQFAGQGRSRGMAVAAGKFFPQGRAVIPSPVEIRLMA